MSKKKLQLYGTAATLAFVVVAAVIIAFFFTGRYMMFQPEKVAGAYVENLFLQNGYESLKYSDLCKNAKLGDLSAEDYFKPFIAEDKELKELDDDELAADYENEILKTVYPAFVELIESHTWDDLREIMTPFGELYAQMHRQVYGEDYKITYDNIIESFENCASIYSEEREIALEDAYGKGADYAREYIGYDSRFAEVVTADTQQNKSAGEYIEEFVLGCFGLNDTTAAGYEAGYGVSYESVLAQDGMKDAYLSALSAEQTEKLSSFGISSEDIDDVATVDTTVTITDANGNEAYTAVYTTTLLKIGSQWYADVLTPDTVSES